MQVNVRLSAGLAQVTGQARMQVTVPDGATVADLVDQLLSQYPDVVATADKGHSCHRGRARHATRLSAAGPGSGLLDAGGWR